MEEIIPPSPPATRSAKRLRIGIDIGGTFTDFVIFHPDTGALDTFKRLSTPNNPAEAVINGLSEAIDRILESVPGSRFDLQIVHGSTVATNALLERKGARVALIATRGFRDVLQIGRQNRPALYDFTIDPPPPLVPASLRFEVDERVDHTGRVLTPLDPSQLDLLASMLRSQSVESVAVCLLFSFLHPEHEGSIASRLRSAGFFVSASSEILPEYREYERSSTTAVNAYVSPILDRYLARLENAGLPGVGAQVQWRVMQSNGGIISLSEARRAGVRCILSGPAGGIIGAWYSAGNSISSPSKGPDHERLKVITFDMGGTSTDVSLIDGVPSITTESIVGGYPIHIPLLDIHTIGAGGGSIATVDQGGALRVGPESAGADPGPACYGRGDLSASVPTVTDANLVLGRLSPEHFLGGLMPLDPGRAEFVFSRLGDRMGLDPSQAALGVVEIANAHMERALRVISVERGYDPREFALLSFGGAGGLHAADLARRLGVPLVLVPPLASTLSAFGMLAADVVKDYTQTVMLPGDTPLTAIRDASAPLRDRGFAEISTEGVPDHAILIEPFLDVRYRGQSYELPVPFSDTVMEDFHQAHNRIFGYNRPEAPVEIVNLRVRASGRIQAPQFDPQPLQAPDPSAAFIGARPVFFSKGVMQVDFYRGEALEPGNHIPGPAIVVRPDTTILLGQMDHAEVDGYSNLVIAIGG